MRLKPAQAAVARFLDTHGLSERQETRFDVTAAVVVALFISGWAVALSDVWIGRHDPALRASVTGRVSASLLDARSRETAFLDEAALRFADPLRGFSGSVRAVFVEPGAPVQADPREIGRSAPPSAGEPPPAAPLIAPSTPGIYRVAVRVDRMRRAVDNFNLITLVPFSEKREGKIGLYYLGNWPYEQGGTPKSIRYADPVGFIEVTPENADTRVSEHFTLRQFLTRDQPDVWPKYLLLDPKLLDKLELMIQELEAEGVEVEHMTVMSGFRTPRYNHSGGNTAGRANLSRHMYGDAADVFVDNDRDGWTDDINGDGEVDVSDSEMMSAAAERVEARFPALVGGIGTYVTCCGHGPFTHLDVRGYSARWRG